MKVAPVTEKKYFEHWNVERIRANKRDDEEKADHYYIAIYDSSYPEHWVSMNQSLVLDERNLTRL